MREKALKRVHVDSSPWDEELSLVHRLISDLESSERSLADRVEATSREEPATSVGDLTDVSDACKRWLVLLISERRSLRRKVWRMRVRWVSLALIRTLQRWIQGLTSHGQSFRP